MTNLVARTCVGCRKRDTNANLVRIVARGDSLCCDVRQRLPGRGAWVHPECLSAAAMRRAFDRALRGTFAVTAELMTDVAAAAAQNPRKRVGS